LDCEQYIHVRHFPLATRRIAYIAYRRPGLLNSLAGIISTLSSVYGAQNHQFSSTSKSTIVVTGGAALICGVLTMIYNNWLLAGVKRRHNEEVGRERTGKHGAGIDPEAKVQVENASEGLTKKASV
jgi:hypothetical protein